MAFSPGDKHPLDLIQWVPVDTLKANSYNPNVVYNQELLLLKFSLLTRGWMQALEIQQGTNEIIDGYHRWHLAKNDPAVRALTAGLVPVMALDLSEPERMMETIRINRAKGSHIACKMHEIVKALVKDYGIPVEAICKGIGATKDEVRLLLMEDVFEKLDIKRHQYSRAWVPK